jgi:5-(carboxyamino)imidazole ribonucleotide synthase
LLPGILKTARLGYDGKGQVRVSTREALAQAWADLGRVTCVIEKLLPLQAECSVIVARGANGQRVSFPVQANTHRDGILALTEVYEGAVPAALAERAVASTLAIADELNYVGVLCVEATLIWSSTKWHRARTTAATTPKTPATFRSSRPRCARWPDCPCPRRASTVRPS